MTAAARKPRAAKLRSAAFRRIRADHQSELAEDYVELIADLIDEKGEARGSDVALRLGVANATASTVVLAFYISSAEVRTLYQEPGVLWLLCLLMLYWSNRIWIGARRGKIHDDPVVFAIKDRVSRYVFLAMIIVVLAARILPKGTL